MSNIFGILRKDLEVTQKLEEIEREEPKQETLEEFINYTLRFNTIADKEVYSQLIRDGAKWEAKRRYSEEEVKQMLIDCCGEVSCEDGLLAGKTPVELYKWIDEQFKKK